MIEKKLMTEERLNQIINFFKNKEPFKDEHDIPGIPIVPEDIYDNVIVPELVRCGAIKKEDLEVGCRYLGTCRNASEAVWDGTVFVYDRTKFGSTFKEKINHFQDDNWYDLFVPIRKIE